MQKVVGSNPISRFSRNPALGRDFVVQGAHRLGREFVDDLRLLLDDLGFPDDDQPPSGVVELTMSPAALGRVVWRLGVEATQVYGDTLPRPEGEQELLERSSLAMKACGRILLAIRKGEIR